MAHPYTWRRKRHHLAVDGATITTEGLDWSEGMGSDVMGGSTSIPNWEKYKLGILTIEIVTRNDNAIYIEEFICTIKGFIPIN